VLKGGGRGKEYSRENSDVLSKGKGKRQDLFRNHLFRQVPQRKRVEEKLIFVRKTTSIGLFLILPRRSGKSILGGLKIVG